MHIPDPLLRPGAFLALALFWPFLLSAQEAGPALRNPSFEIAGSKPEEVPGWGVWGGGVGRVDQWKPTHTGDAMIGYKHWVIRDPGDSGLFQDVAGAIAGSVYEFSLWIYVDKADDKAFGGIELRLESASEGRQLTVATNATVGADIPAGRWVRMSVRGTAAVDNLRVVVVFFPSVEEPRGGAVKIDDAQIVKRP